MKLVGAYGGLGVQRLCADDNKLLNLGRPSEEAALYRNRKLLASGFVREALELQAPQRLQPPQSLH